METFLGFVLVFSEGDNSITAQGFRAIQGPVRFINELIDTLSVRGKSCHPSADGDFDDLIIRFDDGIFSGFTNTFAC